MELLPARVVFRKPRRDGVRIFPINARLQLTTEGFAPSVVARLDTLKNAAAIHHIGLDIDHGALEQSVRKQVASPYVFTIPDTNSRGTMVNEWR